MSKIAEQKALEAYPLPKEEPESTSFINKETFNSAKRTGYIAGYDQAMQDIKQYVEELIRHEEKEWGEHNVDFGLYAILGHVVKIEENE